MALILDCTLRDGGYYNAWDFSADLIQDYLNAMQAAGVDWVELGFRSLENHGFKGACAYTSEAFLDRLNVPPGLQLGVMVNAKELLPAQDQQTKLEQLFPKPASASRLGLVRIACHLHEFEAALPTVHWLKTQGYQVGFNLMQVADSDEATLEQLTQMALAYPLDLLYVADSLGSLTSETTRRLIQTLRRAWTGALGIHTHDNLGLALSNSLAALDEGCTWVDATVTGMGRGPGNAKTEHLLIAQAQAGNPAFNLVPLMKLIQTHFKPLQDRYGWGTNPYYYLAGKYGIHSSYIQEMLNDTRYNEEDLLAVIDYLRTEGGKKFNLTTLDAARHFYQGPPQGQWSPKTDFAGRTLLLLGTGPGVARHRQALEDFIRRHQPLVVALNTQTEIAAELIHYRVACHPVRLLADCKTHTQLPQPLITPYSLLPEEVQQALNNKHVLDFGLEIQADTFSFEDQYALIPSPQVVAYALAVFTSGKAKKVFLAGFDGYGHGDLRTQEMNKIFELYFKHLDNECLDKIVVQSITPTIYKLPSISVYHSC